jgi:adenylate cyclase
LPIERTVRLVTGLLLFSYAGCHFLSHATGVFHLETMEAVGRGVLLAPWRTFVGQSILFGALFVHGGLGVRALVRRRHLRMPALEAWQLGLGLLIPLLLIPHAANVRLGNILYGLDDSYYRLVYQYWITSALFGLPRQFFLLCAVWIHGCIGLHMWLRFRPWYARVVWGLAFIAILIPFLAILGISNAGWDASLRTALFTDFSARNGPPPAGTTDAKNRANLETLWDGLRVAYVGLLAAAFAFRGLRRWRSLRHDGVRILYPDRSPVVVPRGFSVLEASRWAGIPHTSICGARGRCTTCRIRITHGKNRLPRPSAVERATLQRINAPPSVRLACQLRPLNDVGVVPLVAAASHERGLRFAFDEGRELTVTALCVDLRESTGLAAGKLPFDTLYIVDRYVQRVSSAIEAHGGYVTSVAGDGIMSVFGIDGNAASGALNALAAAMTVWDGLDHLGDELAGELQTPLRFGMGAHTGPSVVGSVALSGRPSLQFLGDTGNVASRLETVSRDLAATLVVSEAVFLAAGFAPPSGVERTEVRVRGRGETPPLRG